MEEVKEEIKSKVCKKCKVLKTLPEFYKNRSNEDGYSHWCKDCYKAYLKENRNAKIRNVATDRKVMANMFKENISPVRDKKTTQELKTPKEENKTGIAKTIRFYRNCFLGAYETLASYGLSQQTIQQVFGCSRTGLDDNTLREKEGEETYQRAMAELQANLASKLLVHAIGYDYQEEKVVYRKTRKKWVEERKEVLFKHNPGNAELFIFYLTNRFPKLWKVTRELVTKRDQTYDDDPGQRDRKKIIAIARDVLKGNTGRPETEYPFQDGLARVSGEIEQAGEK